MGVNFGSWMPSEWFSCTNCHKSITDTIVTLLYLKCSIVLRVRIKDDDDSACI